MQRRRGGDDVRMLSSGYGGLRDVAKFDYQLFARRGAELRLSEIEEEIRGIMSAFPDLHRGDIASSAASAVQGRSLQEIIPGDRRRRPRMSAAPRQAVSLRPKQQWGERRRKPRT
jgi:hypothetical protein